MNGWAVAILIVMMAIFTASINKRLEDQTAIQQRLLSLKEARP